MPNQQYEIIPGEEIIFIGGDYVGYQGKQNLAYNDTRKFTHVLIRMADGDSDDDLWPTRVKKEFVWKRSQRVARSREEAAIFQHAKVEKALDRLCRLLTMCEITPASQNIIQLFQERLQSANMRDNGSILRVHWNPAPDHDVN